MKLKLVLFACILMAMGSTLNSYFPTINPWTLQYDQVLDTDQNVSMDNLTLNNIYGESGVINLRDNTRIFGNLTVMEYITHVNISDINANGSIIPAVDIVFQLGNNTHRWSYVYSDATITTDLSAVNLESNLDGTGYNITANWFDGMFNWTISSGSTDYLSFDGSYLSFNETKLNATIDSSPTFVEISGDTMTGMLNMSSHNISNVDCIIFESGGQICDSP